MTLPYCCHIISQIEIEYNSSSDLPKWLIHSFKNPKLNNNGPNYFDKPFSHKSQKNDSLKELYLICNTFLQSYGYSVKHLHKYDVNDSKTQLSISDLDSNKEFLQNDKSSQLSCSSDSDSNVNIGNVFDLEKIESQGIVKSLLQKMIMKSMVYYLSFYEEFSKNYDLLNISKKSYAISKNSSYEMISGLRDCLCHLYESNDPGNEAIVITNDYSGIFSSEDILITRSNLTFRDELKAKGISYLTIYDEIGSFSKNSNLVKKSEEDFSGLVNSYLMNQYKDINPKSQESNLDLKSMGKKSNFSKFYLLKSLKLPESEDYDINVIRIRGKSNCHKLFKYIDKTCMNSLLSSKNDKYSNVRLILTNFPTLFSKVNQARFSVFSDEGKSKIAIRGLIMPSVLMTLFEILKILESNNLIRKPTVKLKYNLTFDDEMYEKALRISENKIYDQFLNNFSEIRRNFGLSYKALKKLIPFNKFTLRKGKITVSPETRFINLLKKDKLLALDNKPSTSKTTVLATYRCVPSGIVIVKDTLYFSLSKVKLYLSNIEGYSHIMNKSTKKFLDESFSRVSHSNLDELEFGNLSRCYLDLYPNEIGFKSKESETVDFNDNEVGFLTNGTSVENSDLNTTMNSFASDNSTTTNQGMTIKKETEDYLSRVLNHVLPQNLTSVIWILSYLLHYSGKVEFYDTKSFENIMNYDIFTLNIKENPLSSPKDTGDFEIVKSLNYPLSQQSYFVQLSNHIIFNKEFHKKFGVKYQDYLNNPYMSVSSQDNENIQVIEQVLNLTSGWKSYFKHKSKSQELLSQESGNFKENEIKKNAEVNKTSKNIGEIVEKVEKSPKRQKKNKSNKDKINVEIGPYNQLLYKYSINRNKLASVNNTFKVDFGTVFSSSRKHGRVHHCSFDFDSFTTFDDLYYGENYNIVDEFTNVIGKELTINLQEKIHYILLFMFSNDPSSLECLHLKMIKDVLNSNLIKFSNQEPNYESLDLSQLNHLNVDKFINLFTTNQFGSGGNVMVKNSISYSLLSSDLSLNDLYIILNQIDKDTKINIISLPLIHGTIKSFTKSSLKVIRIFNIINREYLTRLHFVDLTWIFDSYFSGIINLNSIPGDYILQYNMDNSTQYSLEDFSIQYFKEDCSSQLRFTLDDLNEFTYSQNKYSSQESNQEVLSQLSCSLEYLKDDSQSQFNFSEISKQDSMSFTVHSQDYKEFKNSLETLKDVESFHISFRDSYRHLKNFWGWTIYLLTESDITISQEDCTLYRKHCGITFKKLDNLKEIQNSIEKDILDGLSKFNIDESDLSEFFTYDKILINSVIISDSDSMNISELCIYPYVSGKKICLGGYNGIPILSYTWFIKSLSSSNLYF